MPVYHLADTGRFWGIIIAFYHRCLIYYGRGGRLMESLLRAAPGWRRSGLCARAMGAKLPGWWDGSWLCLSGVAAWEGIAL